MSEDIHIINIPAENPAKFLRDDFIKPPDWRYQAASKFVQDTLNGKTPQIPTDACIQYAARAILAFRAPESREYMRQCWDSMYKVLYLGTAAPDSAITSEIETLLIRGVPSDDPEVQLLPFSTAVYELYSKLFFDLSGITAIHTWMHDYLFAPQYTRGSFGTKLRARLLAYYGSPEASRHAGVLGGVSPDALALMKSLMSNERQRRLFDYSMQKLNIGEEEYAMLMEAAIKDAASRDFTERMKDRADASAESLEGVAEGLEAAIRAFTQDELATVKADGLDFDNRYTQHILRKTNGTENSTAG